MLGYTLMKRKSTIVSPLARIIRSFALIFSGILIILVSVADAAPVSASNDGTHNPSSPYYCCGTIILPDKAISRSKKLLSGFP
jgi:hypothetical protein